MIVMVGCSYDWTSTDSTEADGAAAFGDEPDSEAPSSSEMDAEAPSELIMGGGPDSDSEETQPEPDTDADEDPFDPGQGNVPDAGEMDSAAAVEPNVEADPDATIGVRCYRDNDGDGAGAGESFACPASTDDAGLSLTGNDCDDGSPLRSPTQLEICDLVDNDCDDRIDEDTTNACGGPCSISLAHRAGDPCNNGLRGACARDGSYVCQSDGTIACNAPSAVASSERCADGVDNDCNGLTDEPEASDAKTWRQDCDEDGFLSKSSVRSCTQPTQTQPCATWTSVAPPTGEGLDCDDTSALHHPGADYGVAPPGTIADLNCNGVVEKYPGVFINSSPPELLAVCATTCAAGSGSSCAAWKPSVPTSCGQTASAVIRVRNPAGCVENSLGTAPTAQACR